MGTITTGIGLISGINTGQLIDSLIALESRGKISLQTRIAALQAQRSAMMDINARLLNMKNAAKAFRIDKIFQSALATSSNEDVLTASAGKGAAPGSYQFIVKQLAAASQKLTRGFADKATTPLGLSSLSFEFGHGSLTVDRDLEALNGGDGVDRGRIAITDRSGAQATIDLTDVTTINEVLARINDASGIQVSAAVEGDHLVLTDTSGGSGSLTVANGVGDTTATDLGIASTVAGNTLTGSNINTLGGETALTALNDGNGVLTRNNVTDFTVTARDGTVLNIDLGRINLPISNSTLLADLNNGRGVTIGADGNTDIKFVDRAGATHDVNLTGVTTVGGLITRVASETGGAVVLSINADGKRLTVTDTTAGTGNLKVLGAGANGTDTAEDLGILNVAGVAANSFDGSIIPSTISDPPAATINDVIDRINDATGNGGKIVASIAGDGVSLLITDTTGGAGNLIIRRTASNPYAAAALGIETAVAGVAAPTVDGERLIAALGSVLMNNLNGGTGLGSGTAITIQDRSGAQVTVNNLDTYDSLSEIISAINTQAAAANVDVTIDLNNAGNGLSVTDSSGGSGNLTISGDAAAALGLEADVAATTVRGSNLQLRYVSEATKLSQLNYGRGIGIGKFRITDGLGESAVVDIGSDATTLQDVIEEINSRGLAVNARINDTGDGLLIEADLGVGQTPVTSIRIVGVSGSTAKDLNILGTSSTVLDAKIDGSYERTVTLAESDTLAKVMKKINDAGIPVNASILSAGSGATPFHMNLTSNITGRLGDLIVDSGNVDLGLTTLTQGQDAKVFFGSDDPENAMLVTNSSNTITSVLEGVTINLLSTGDEAVTLTVQRDTEAIVTAAKQFATTFNDAIGRINQYDFYNVDTEQRGPLLGNSTTANVREGLYRIAQGKAKGIETQYQYLWQVGMTIGRDGQMQFDDAKFRAAYESDPEAVENLLAAYQASTTSTTEISPGVWVAQTNVTISQQGFGDMFDSLLDRLTNAVDGVMTRAGKGLQDQIELATQRISAFDERLAAKRKRLEAQFVAMETALARLQGQSTSLGSLAANVLMAQTGGQ